jgi:hypothetical protein
MENQVCVIAAAERLRPTNASIRACGTWTLRLRLRANYASVVA